MKTTSLLTIATAAVACVASVTAQDIPHLAQAWTAQSTGDGLPGKIGNESYLYCTDKEASDTCIKAHVFDYGADNCIKYEINRGTSKYTGTFYVACDAVDCCYDGENRVPDVKQWDIGASNLFDKVEYLGKQDTTELNDVAVKDADVYTQKFHIPFTKVGVNYTYFVTEDGNNDTITHRIDFSAPGAAGTILYGDFQVVHDIDSFRSTFVPPDVCLKPNTLRCTDKQLKSWNRKYFKHAAAKMGL